MLLLNLLTQIRQVKCLRRKLIDQLLHVLHLLDDLFWRLPLPDVVDGHHGNNLQPVWLVLVEVPEGPCQIPDPANTYGLLVDVLGHLQLKCY